MAIGCEEHSKGYRIRVPQEKRIEILRNLLIREEHESKIVANDNNAYGKVVAIPESSSKE